MSAFRTLVLASSMALGLSTMAVAQDRVTIMLRSGETVNGRFDGVNQGLFHIDVSDTDERKIPLGQVAVVDLAGGATNLPETELREARGGSHVLVTRNGQLVRGQLVTVEGARVSGNEDPATVVFRAEGGEERRIRMSEVTRLYLGNYPGAAPSTGGGSSGGGSLPGGGRSFTVRGSDQWTDTGIDVRSGDQIYVDARGDIQLTRDAGSRTSANGSGRGSNNYPVPGFAAGALIGKINDGRPFSVGAGGRITVPDSGRLWLGINDDDVSDNSGQFDVRVSSNGNDRSGGARRRRP